MESMYDLKNLKQKFEEYGGDVFVRIPGTDYSVLVSGRLSELVKFLVTECLSRKIDAVRDKTLRSLEKGEVP